MIIVYAADPATEAATVARKKWQSPTTGDVRVLQGSHRRNSFDLVNRAVRRDHVYAGGGADYVFMKADGYRDVIQCGPGNDLVQFIDRREKRDVYLGCEKLTGK